MLSSHASLSGEGWEVLELGLELIALLLLRRKTRVAPPDELAEDGNGQGAEKNEHGDLVLLVEAIGRDVFRSGAVGGGGGVVLGQVAGVS